MENTVDEGPATLTTRKLTQHRHALHPEDKENKDPPPSRCYAHSDALGSKWWLSTKDGLILLLSRT